MPPPPPPAPLPPIGSLAGEREAVKGKEESRVEDAEREEEGNGGVEAEEAHNTTSAAVREEDTRTDRIRPAAWSLTIFRRIAAASFAAFEEGGAIGDLVLFPPSPFLFAGGGGVSAVVGDFRFFFAGHEGEGRKGVVLVPCVLPFESPEGSLPTGAESAAAAADLGFFETFPFGSGGREGARETEATLLSDTGSLMLACVAFCFFFPPDSGIGVGERGGSERSDDPKSVTATEPSLYCSSIAGLNVTLLSPLRALSGNDPAPFLFPTAIVG